MHLKAIAERNMSAFSETTCLFTIIVLGAGGKCHLLNGGENAAGARSANISHSRGPVGPTASTQLSSWVQVSWTEPVHE